MTVISDDTPIASWKDKLLGNLGSNVNSQKEEDFNLMEGDAAKEVVDGIPSIALSKRVHNFIAQRMARTVVILDLENDYFSVRFQDDNEYLTAILGGLWTIFGHYLMVRPWTPGFSTDQAQPSNLMVWIRLPGLPKGMYTTSLLKFIGGTIGPVAKIDRNTDNRARGQFAHLMVFVDLGQPLVSNKDRWKDSTARVRVSTNETKKGRPRPVAAKLVGGTAAGETSCFRIFGGNLVDATGINAQESNADDVSQRVTTQIGGVSGTTTKGCFG
ncbi:hypothetical protein GOBAR_DD20420 [Gossypium barbadense]|nr:hypothetical protein GOBAR_DD20420 [Gossypium barbadense]